MPVVKLAKVDLCPKKPDPKILVIEGTVAEVELNVTSKKPIASVVMKRLEDKAAKPVLEQYGKVIQQEVLILEKKIAELVKNKNTAAAEKMVAETQLSVRNACKALQSAVNVAVQKQIAIDAKNDAALREAQILVVLKGALITLKISINIAQLAASHGADVTAYISLAKGVYELVKLVMAEVEAESKTRADFGKAIVVYKQKVSADPSQKAKLGPPLDDLRKRHRNKVTKMRQNLEKLSLKTDELVKKSKDAKTLKQGVRIGADAMEMKRKVSAKYTVYMEIEQLADALVKAATSAGMVLDDRTFLEKLTIKDMATFANDMKGIVEDIVELAAA